MTVFAAWRQAAARDNGFIQVRCEPGVRISLDGIFKGVSTREQEGLVIDGVPAGLRIVTAEQAGFKPKQHRIEVGAGAVAILPITLTPMTGSIRVGTVPVDSAVHVEQLRNGAYISIQRLNKQTAETLFPNLPVGSYRVTVSTAAHSLTTTVDLTADDTVTVFANLVGQTISSRSSTTELLNAGGLIVDIGGGESMRLVAIKPGKFVMGSPEGVGDSDEHPQRTVQISSPYWLGQTEVTLSQWQAIMADESRTPDPLAAALAGERGPLSPPFALGPNHPIENVSWGEANEFCRRLSARIGMTVRLPTEAEWEFACRAGTSSAFSFGNDPARLADFGWFASNSGRRNVDSDEMGLFEYTELVRDGGLSTHPVGTTRPNAWGLHDMHGNVWEWVQDWYAPYPDAPATDPSGPDLGSERVMRGGGRQDQARNCRSANRSVPNSLSGRGKQVGYTWFGNGFRVAVVDSDTESRRAADKAAAESERRAAVQQADEAARSHGIAQGVVIDLGHPVSLQLIAVQPGSFAMGSAIDANTYSYNLDDERPQHEVRITKEFLIGQTEVTEGQWSAVMGKAPRQSSGDPSRPVQHVSWAEAQAFCRRLSARSGLSCRLPTEAEWEFACRAGRQTDFSFGDNSRMLSEFGWFADNSGGAAMPVATRKANPWGLHDMHGNVWEWVQDWYGPYSAGSTVDPSGPPSGQERVVRGGSWGSNEVMARSANRWSGPNVIAVEGGSVGFRVAADREARPLELPCDLSGVVTYSSLSAASRDVVEPALLSLDSQPLQASELIGLLCQLNHQISATRSADRRAALKFLCIDVKIRSIRRIIGAIDGVAAEQLPHLLTAMTQAEQAAPCDAAREVYRCGLEVIRAKLSPE